MSRTSIANNLALPCPACGYDLRGATDRREGMIRCPECGRSFSRRRLARAAQVHDPEIDGWWVAGAIAPSVAGVIVLNAALFCRQPEDQRLFIALFSLIAVFTPVYLLYLAGSSVKRWKMSAGTVGTAIALAFGTFIINVLIFVLLWIVTSTVMPSIVR
jgi:hypothetical protein